MCCVAAVAVFLGDERVCYDSKSGSSASIMHLSVRWLDGGLLSEKFTLAKVKVVDLCH